MNNSMIKYLTSQKYRLKKMELADLEMLGEEFRDFKEERIRQYLRTLKHLHFNEELEGCFSVLRELYQSKSPLQLVKVFCFWHILTQEAPAESEELLSNEVGQFLKAIQENTETIKQRSKSVDRRSVEKTLHWIQDKLGRKKSASLHKDSDIVSKEDFLRTKIIQPYVVYLTKSLTLLPFYQLCRREDTVAIHEVWLLIRILRHMLAISNNFGHAGRYFKQEFLKAVLTLKKILSKEVKVQSS